MRFWSEKDLQNFHQVDYRKVEHLEESGDLGCFYCTSVYDYSLVDKIIESEGTARCPICGIDAVMPLSEIPEEKWSSLLLAMYLKYFAESEMTLGDLNQKHFYLYQVPNRFQDDVIWDLEKVFDRTKRKIKENIYSYYGYTQSFTFPVYKEEITIYPLGTDFVERMLPAFYEKDELPKGSIPILKRIVEKGPAASFLIDLPGSLEPRKAEHLVKLLGMAFGGYFAKLEDLPADGRLNEKDHIFIRPYPKDDYDILDHLEELVEKLG